MLAIQPHFPTRSADRQDENSDKRIVVTGSADEDSDKLAIAQEVIVSAGNILVAAGFRREEIAAFFRQAADQLASSAPVTSPVSEPVAPRMPMVAGETTAGKVPPPRAIAEIQAEFPGIPPVRALADLAAGPDIIAGLRDGTERASRHVDLALEMLPQVAEAQNWLRDMAMEAGMDVVASRGQCLADASPEDGAEAGNTLFLDDFEGAYAGCFDFVTTLAGAAVRDTDEETLNLLLRGLVSCGIIITHDLKVQLEESVRTLIPHGAAGAT